MILDVSQSDASRSVQPVTRPLVVTWEKLPSDYVLPNDPAEKIQQSLLAAALTDSLGAAN